jgi:hypothetical protein
MRQKPPAGKLKREENGERVQLVTPRVKSFKMNLQLLKKLQFDRIDITLAFSTLHACISAD